MQFQEVPEAFRRDHDSFRQYQGLLWDPWGFQGVSGIFCGVYGTEKPLKRLETPLKPPESRI